MRAMVLSREGLEMRSVTTPNPGPGEVLIRVANCAICQSDVHWKRDHQATLGPEGHILGHEFAGEVVAIGSGVSNVSLGARVTARPLASCGHCVACRRGLPRACPERSAVGLTRAGAFAEFVIAAAQVTYPIPGRVSFAAAALAEPLACAYNAVITSNVRPGDWVVVIGPGPLGLLATRLLKLQGAKVIVAGTRDDRLVAATHIGADLVCNVRGADLGSLVKEQTDGLGADVAIEMVGTNEALAQAFAVTRLAGQVTLAGDPEPNARFTLAPARLFNREQRLIASLGAGESIPRVLRLLDEKLVDPEALITHRFPLENAPLAFETVLNRQNHCLKALIECP